MKEGGVNEQGTFGGGEKQKKGRAITPTFS